MDVATYLPPLRALIDPTTQDALAGSDDVAAELAALQAEADLPIEELRRRAAASYATIGGGAENGSDGSEFQEEALSSDDFTSDDDAADGGNKLRDLARELRESGADRDGGTDGLLSLLEAPVESRSGSGDSGGLYTQGGGEEDDGEYEDPDDGLGVDDEATLLEEEALAAREVGVDGGRSAGGGDAAEVRGGLTLQLFFIRIHSRLFHVLDMHTSPGTGHDASNLSGELLSTM